MLSAVVCVGGVMLGLLRDASGDETIYLRDAAVMADCLRHGQWFGNEAVGTHGFIFKLPVALLFLITGNSIFVATLTTILLASASVWLCFRAFKKIIGREEWALVGTWLVVTNYHFVLSTPTFLREMPALFSVLLLLNAMMDRRGRWIIGVVLLLILDAKEYVFFVLAPACLVWIVADEWRKRARGSLVLSTFRVVLARWTAVLMPAFAYIILMLCTGVVPLNRHTAYVLGFIEGGMDSVLFQFSPAVATANLWGEGRLIAQIDPTYFGTGAVAMNTVRIANLFLAYFGKLLYPRTFSFISIPKVFVFPAVMMSVLLIWRSTRDDRARLLGPAMLMWAYLAAFILRASHGRYLFPILPLLVLFFVEYLRRAIATKKWTNAVLILTAAFVGGGFCFEESNLVFKLLLSTAALSLLTATVLISRLNADRGRIVAMVSCVALGVMCASVAIASSILLPGQIGRCLALGQNKECRDVMNQFSGEQKIWVNNAGWDFLPLFYRREPAAVPEMKWPLQPWVPKKDMLRWHDGRTFAFEREHFGRLKVAIIRSNVDGVGLVVSEEKGYRFAMQDWLDQFRQSKLLVLEKTVPLKNKTLYVFSVVGDGESNVAAMQD